MTSSRILTPSPEHAARILKGEPAPMAFTPIRVMGIDPGSVSGAYALMDTTPAGTIAKSMPGSVVEIGDLPVVDKQVDAASFRDLIQKHRPDIVMLERVSAMPKQGVTSTFNFGVGVGTIRGVVSAMEIALIEVPASKWKKRFNLSQDKERSRHAALTLYPGQSTHLARKKDHGRAEALLLAHYAKEQL